eukprot:285765-Chlamydomonas_euryale.AAC.5
MHIHTFTHIPILDAHTGCDTTAGLEDGLVLEIVPYPPHAPHSPTPSLAPFTASSLAGFGITAVLEDGSLLEKAAANVSVIRGILTPARAQAMSSRGRAGIDPAGGQPYAAAALSLVFHSAHPMVPTLRGDVRLFQVWGAGAGAAGVEAGVGVPRVGRQWAILPWAQPMVWMLVWTAGCGHQGLCVVTDGM